MKSFSPKRRAIITFLFTFLAGFQLLAADRLRREFLTPPDSARPWVYWFWLNGNITKEGITADLEAMHRVGIRGVLIMEVDQGAPVGPVDFMSARWRELFTHVHHEAQRLGLEVNMNNDAGWNGSGGPWIKPEQAMQKIIWNETNVSGPLRFEATLPVPEHNANFYRDICLLAFPKAGEYRIPNIRAKAAFEMGNTSPSGPTNLTPEMIIDRKLIRNVSAHMDKDGRLAWDVPNGEWTIVRFGNTTTGVENAPAPKSGRGLECDKLNPAGIEANFEGMMAQLVNDTGIAETKQTNGLAATHIDSWENGSQNWTTDMRQQFQARRGYDLESFLPVVTGRVVDSLEISERFLWDLRKTVSDLVIENYSGRMKQLAHRQGLRYTVEAYGSPCDFLPYAGQADEPMGEFWVPSGAMETCKGMACAGHIYGKQIIGAEAFTADDRERWLQHPGSLKALGDRAFCEGINRFVFHRYALQPWVVPERRPGMMMGPWGEHYERTQTWWEQSTAWHEYLARCQLLLREGTFVADICYLQAEAPPQGFNGHPREGYDWDECPPELVIKQMKATSSRIQLPGGMSYRVLVLPSAATTTPELLKAIRELVRDGATLIGAPPEKSPSLNRYPDGDAELRQVAADLWADCDGTKIKRRPYGQGMVVRGIEPEEFLKQNGVPPDFQGDRRLHFIHRRTGSEDIYFIASSAKSSLDTVATFRIAGKVPEFWWPDTGRTERAALFHVTNGVTSIGLQLPMAGSVFVLFREKLGSETAICSLRKDATPVLDCMNLKSRPKALKAIVEKARYGILADPARTRDVRDKLQKILDAGETTVRVARMAEGDDPAFLVVKTLEVDYSVDSRALHLSGTDPEELDFEPAETTQQRLATLHVSDKGKPTLEAWCAGNFEAATASGRNLRCVVENVPAPLPISGPWQIRLQSGPDRDSTIGLNQLVSWPEHPDARLKYFSGTAVYSNRVEIPAGLLAKNQRVYLELGDVQVMAEVTLNSHRLPLLWKAPFTVDITSAAKQGWNRIEIKVVNLWPNRLIGDELLPEDSDRNPDGTLKNWPTWVLDGKPSPTGRSTFVSWRLWKKQDALIPSGLIGPVRLRFSKLAELK